jgi:hypothetical protein
LFNQFIKTNLNITQLTDTCIKKNKGR